MPTIEEKTTFLNVDLDLGAPFDLSPLLDALGAQVDIISRIEEDDQQFAALELSSELHDPHDADTAIRVLAGLVEALPPDVRELWDQCTSRCFNVGIQAGLGPYTTPVALDAETVAAAAAIRARLEITVYGAEVADP